MWEADVQQPVVDSLWRIIMPVLAYMETKVWLGSPLSFEGSRSRLVLACMKVEIQHYVGRGAPQNERRREMAQWKVSDRHFAYHAAHPSKSETCLHNYTSDMDQKHEQS